MADEADYHEIHFAITMLKTFEGTELVTADEPVLSSLLSITKAFGSGRRAFLLDILVEARGRKRP